MARKKRRDAARHAALVQLVQTPAPAEYDYVPHNRAQRRLIARQLRRGAGKRGPQGGPK
jgi:hypothetical protein